MGERERVHFESNFESPPGGCAISRWGASIVSSWGERGGSAPIGATKNLKAIDFTDPGGLSSHSPPNLN